MHAAPFSFCSIHLCVCFTWALFTWLDFLITLVLSLSGGTIPLTFQQQLSHHSLIAVTALALRVDYQLQ